MNRKKSRYLSWRIAVVALGVLCSAVLVMIAMWCNYKIGNNSFIPVALSLVLFVICCCCFIGFVWLPYCKLESKLRQFLQDSNQEKTQSNTTEIVFSPSMEHRLKREAMILSPTQLFHINKRQAQYLALQNQINPHFLYNTLESIRSEALVAQLNSVAEMTEALALFFRYTISKVENLVSVEEELQNCETYFCIQQYRFGERLALCIECADEDRAQILHCRLPKLTLQPILENSIIHGTEQKLGTGHLTIVMELTDTRLLIRISDDGVGMDTKTLERINAQFGRVASTIDDSDTKKGGLALANVDNRIRLLFGDAYGLQVFSLEGSGTDVEITLPVITSDREISNHEVL